MYYLRSKIDCVHDGVLVAKKNVLYEVTNYKKGQITFVAEDGKKTIVHKGGEFGFEIVIKEE